MNDAGSWRELLASPGVGSLLLLCGGVWLFAADGLMLATLLPGIVSEIGGAQLVGWAGALFQAASIVAGAFTSYALRRFGMRTAFAAAAAGVAVGCVVSAMAPDMATLQAGRFFQAFSGGALVALAHVGAAHLFPPALTTRALALVSVVWGTAAFSGPLIGAVFVEFGSWRMAFWFAALVALLLAAFAVPGLAGYERSANDPAAPREDFPLLRMVVLMAAVLTIASASLTSGLAPSLALILVGGAMAYGFLRLDGMAGERRLLPADALSGAGTSGAALVFVFFAGAATVVMGVFGPLLLDAYFGMEPLVIGYVLFSASLGWTLMALITASLAERHEKSIIVLAAGVIALSPVVILIGFVTGQPLVVAFGVMMDGAGFGSCWGLIIRRAVSHAAPREKDRIASAIPTVERAGLAFGAAFLSIAANWAGFSDLMSRGTALSVAIAILGASAALGAVGFFAAVRLARPRAPLVQPVSEVPPPSSA